MGRYIEEEVALPDSSGTLLSGRDQRLEFFTYKEGELHRYLSDDGEAWSEQEMPGFAALNADAGTDGFVLPEQHFNSIAVDGDNIYLAGSMNDLSAAHLYCSRDGGSTFAEIEMEGWDETNERGIGKCIPFSIKALGDGKILVMQQLGAVQIYDTTDGSRVAELETEGMTAALFEGSLVLPNADYTGLSRYDPSTGSEMGEIPAGGSLMYTNLTTGADGALYMTDRGGIHRMAEGSGLWETLVDGELTSLSMPSLYNNGALLGRDGSLFVCLGDGVGADMLMRYRYDASVPSVPDTELVVYSLENNATVRQAIGEFQRENPSVRVSYRVGMGDDAGAVTKGDLIRALNTELLAGKGPDVLILDGMNIESYIEKGVLLDLNEFLADGIASGELAETFMNAYERGGKRYAVPTRISVPVMVGSSDALRQADSLQALAGAAEAGQSGGCRQFLGVTPNGSGADNVERFYETCAPAWYDGNGALDAEKLAEFLELMKRITDAGQGERQRAFEQIMEEESARYGEDPDIIKGMAAEVASLSDMAEGYSALHIETIRSWNDLMPLYGMLEKVEDGAVAPLCGQAAGVYIPQGIIAVNAAGSRTELAGEFVRSVLDESVQNTDLFDGFPVNLKSMQSATRVQNNVYMGSSMGPYNTEGGWPTEAQLVEIMELCQSLKTPSTVDETLLTMIQEETGTFFEGQGTAAQAAQAVVQRARAYLAE